jgi:hypothetical protein
MFFESDQYKTKTLVGTAVLHLRRQIVQQFPTPEMPSQSIRLSKDMCPKMDSDEHAHLQGMPYQEAIGAILYISTKTRPEISHALQQAFQFYQNLGKQHWRAVFHILN